MSVQKISLEELIVCPEVMRLLVLHTPTPIDLTMLTRCTNIIKLDISNNALKDVPYLGHLKQLKFLFLHGNRLSLQGLKTIFMKNSEKSPLCLNITWVTFWGNGNQFQARHFLTCQTSVIAVDKNLVVEEQRQPIISTMEAFSIRTELPFPLICYAQEVYTEDEYIQQFFLELRQLRRRYNDVNPIVRIQSWWRSKLFRLQISRKVQEEKRRCELARKAATHWLRITRNRKRLKQILEMRGKPYLLFSLKEMQKRKIMDRLRAWSGGARERVAQRKILLRMQYRIVNALKVNRQNYRQLYNFLELEKHNKVYVQKEHLRQIYEEILPIVETLNPQSTLKFTHDTAVFLNRLNNHQVTSKLPFTNMIVPCMKANITTIRERQKRKISYGSLPIKMLKRFSLSNKEVKSAISQELLKNRNKRTSLVQIEGSQRQIKDMLRLVHQYNIKNNNKIMIFPEKITKIISAVITIQRCFRGWSQRRKNNYKQEYLRRRAAIRIQRWIRNLPWKHRTVFMKKQQKQIKNQQSKRIILRLQDYLGLQNCIQRRRMKFLQQNSEAVLRKQTISLRWQASSTAPNMTQLLHVLEDLEQPVFGRNYLKDILGQIDFKAEPIDCYKLLHYDAKTTRFNIEGQQYICFKYERLEECKIRAFITRLLTYNFNSKHNIGIRNQLVSQKNDIKVEKIQTLNTEFTFVYPTNWLISGSQEIMSADRVYETELVIYNKDKGKITKVTQNVNYCICRRIDTLQKLISVKRQGNTPKNLYIQQLKCEQSLPVMGKAMVGLLGNVTVPKRKEKKTRTRRAQLEQLKQKSMKLESQSSVDNISKSHSHCEVLGALPPPIIIETPVKEHKRLYSQPVSVSQPPSFLTELNSKKSLLRDDNHFSKHFVRISNFLSKEHQKNELRNRHQRLLTQITELVHRSRERELTGIEVLKACQEEKMKKAQEQSREYKEMVQFEREKSQRYSVSKSRSVQLKPKEPKERGYKELRKNLRLVFPEEIYPVESKN